MEKASSYFLSLSFSNPKETKIVLVLKVPFCTLIISIKNVVKQLKTSVAELVNVKLWKHQSAKAELFLTESQRWPSVCLGAPPVPCGCSGVFGSLFSHHSWKSCQSSQHAKMSWNLGVCTGEIQFFWPQICPWVSRARISCWLETLLLC